MLLPTLWLNSMGVYCEKRDSFKLIEKYFTEDELEIITCASEIRRNWKEDDNLNVDEIPSWVRKVLGENYLKRGGKLAEVFSGKTIK